MSDNRRRQQDSDLLLLEVEQLCLIARWGDEDMIWAFPTQKSAIRHLRKYERFFSGWSYFFGFRFFSVVVGEIEDPDEKISYPSSPQPGLMQELAIFFAPQAMKADDREHSNSVYTAFQHWSLPVLREIVAMAETPTMKGIVKLQRNNRHRQVALTENHISIGGEISNCFRYCQKEYWHGEDYDSYLTMLRDDINADGSNAITLSYRTFDPTTGLDPLRCFASYRMINGGPDFGYYLLCESTGDPEPY